MHSEMSRKDFLLSLPLASLVLAGCKRASDSGPAPGRAAEGKKVVIGYMGLTCEAPIYIAKEKGYFDAEGLEVELVRCEWTQFKDLLGLGKIHMGQQPVVMFLKPIEEGLDAKMAAGVHKGCLRIQAPPNGPIKTVADLKGKKIGVPGMGTPPRRSMKSAISRMRRWPARTMSPRGLRSSALAWER